MSLMNDKNKKTGAKRAVVATSLALALFAGMPQVAYADVCADNVIGDLQVTEDRTQIKRNDVTYLSGRYNDDIDLTEIEKAVTLSNALNGYYYDTYYYTNTTPNEMVNIDINTMYSRYMRAIDRGTDMNFCSSNLYNKPACDGFITLATRSVSSHIKGYLIDRVSSIYESQDKKVTGTPRIVIDGDNLYCVIKVDGKLRKVVINGNEVTNIINMIIGLDNVYNTAINNISGVSTVNDGSFIYNGVERYSGESVYFSIPDDNKKMMVLNGITMAREIVNGEDYLIEVNSTGVRLSWAEKRKLREMGYSEYQIENARKDTITLTKTENKKLTK